MTRLASIMKLSLVSLFTVACAAACSSSNGPSLNPERSNCSTVCERVQECVTPNEDVEKCTNDCSDKSEKDASYKGQVQECSDCVVGKVCSDTSKCAGDCLKILFQ